jgi:hypothetical protein
MPVLPTTAGFYCKVHFQYVVCLQLGILEAACEDYFRHQSTRLSFPMLSVAKRADHLGLTSLCKFAAEATVQRP